MNRENSSEQTVQTMHIAKIARIGGDAQKMAVLSTQLHTVLTYVALLQEKNAQQHQGKEHTTSVGNASLGSSSVGNSSAGNSSVGNVFRNDTVVRASEESKQIILENIPVREGNFFVVPLLVKREEK